MLPLLFIPSVLITLVFFLSGFEKIIRFPISTSKFAKKLRLPLTLSQLIIIVVIMLEIAAPSIIMAYTYSKNVSLVPFFKPSVVALMAFTVMATAIYHNPLKGRDSYYAFMSNVSTFGGLLAIYNLA